MYNNIVLFGTNLSNELFEYANATNSDIKNLKQLLLRNVDAVFDENVKESLRKQINQFGD